MEKGGKAMRPMTRLVIIFLGLHLACSTHVSAFALGEVSVQSRRGEPLVAHIRLVLDAREREKEVVVTLGSQADYQAEGLTRPPFIDVLRVAIASTHDHIRLTSAVAIQEPAFELVLSVRAGQVTIVKHYRVTVPAAAPVAPPTASVATRPPTVFPTPTQMAPVAMAAPKPAAKPARTAPKRPERPAPAERGGRPEHYGPVERGETLYSVVRKLRVPSDKLWQAAVVVWHANKGQFHAGNLHGLPVGTILDIPANLGEQLTTVRSQEAQEIVAQQWDAWQTAQRPGLGKTRLAVAARATDAAVPGQARPGTTPKRDATPPAEKPAEPTLPTQAVVLSAGQPGNMVSAAELHTALQGLEERLLRRIYPTAPPSQPQEVKAPTALVSAMDLQTSIQHLEERLTQRLHSLVLPAPDPLQVGPRTAYATPAVSPGASGVESTQSMLLILLPYVLVLSNVFLLLLGGGLVWLWLRRRERSERNAA